MTVLVGMLGIGHPAVIREGQGQGEVKYKVRCHCADGQLRRNFHLFNRLELKHNHLYRSEEVARLVRRRGVEDSPHAFACQAVLSASYSISH